MTIVARSSRDLATQGLPPPIAAAWAVLNAPRSPGYDDALLHVAGGVRAVDRPRRPDDPVDYGPGPTVRVMARVRLPEGEARGAALREARARRQAAEAALAPAREEVVRGWLANVAMAVKGAPRGDELAAAIDGHVQWLLGVWGMPAVCFTGLTLADGAAANPAGFWPAAVELKDALASRRSLMARMLEQASGVERALAAPAVAS